jgi:Zn-dependent protease with chaperone function/uncharacterized tellurite resistance protein B-like protein
LERDVPKDIVEGSKWIEKAAEQGYSGTGTSSFSLYSWPAVLLGVLIIGALLGVIIELRRRAGISGQRLMGLAPALIRALGVMLAIPAIGFGVSFWIISFINADLAKDGIPPYQTICALPDVLADPDWQAACDEFSQIQLLGDASILAAVIAVGVLALYLLASVVAGKNRSRIALIFPPLVGFSLLAVSISVLLQGGILTYAAYIGEVYAIERVHFFIIGGIGLGALIASIKLISVSFTYGKKLTTPVFGKSLNETTAPTLFGFVRELAEKLGARPPKNIVAGLEPNFFVTNCDVALIGEDKTLSGETLYVSPPLARLMTKDELAAVIGHELGHFRGEDTAYSMKFAPVYAGLGRALGVVQSEDDEGVSGLAKLPALAMLSFMYELFARNEAAISRERELKADEAGAEVSSPHSLGVALIKVALYSGLREHARENNIERLNEGKIARNLSLIFQNSAKFDVEHENLNDIIDEVLEQSIPHPTDTHPPVGSRLSALNVEASKITKQMLQVPSYAAIELFDKVAEIEEELTTLEHRFMVTLGQVNFPDEEEQEKDYVLQAAYCLAAAMVTADKKIEPDEITVAEGIGNRLFEDYDPVEFREYINHPENIPDIDDLTQIIGDVLPEEEKILILKYLKAISEVDKDVDEREAALLSKIATQWQIDENALLGDSGEIARADEAERMETRAKAIRAKHVPADPVEETVEETIWDQHNVEGVRALEQGNYVEAEDWFKSALMEAENFGPEDPRLATSLNNLAELFRIQGRYEEAADIEARAKAIAPGTHWVGRFSKD